MVFFLKYGKTLISLLQEATPNDEDDFWKLSDLHSSIIVFLMCPTLDIVLVVC